MPDRPVPDVSRPRGLRVRVLVTGSRNWTAVPVVWKVLDIIALEGPITVIEGGAPGADAAAADWARVRGMDLLEFPADWKTYGKAAGPIRNQQMLDEGKPDRVVAFSDNLDASRGTKDMVRRTVAAGIPHRLYSSDWAPGF